jgi:hypothetical protein
MHDIGILNDDGSLGSSAAWIPPPPVLLAPALVGNEAPVRFEDTGAWKPLANTRKKEKGHANCSRAKRLSLPSRGRLPAKQNPGGNP